MNLKSRKVEKNEAEIIVEVSREEFDVAINEAYKKVRNQISVPGFRKGKAPRKIVERMYGESVFYNDAFDALLPVVMTFVTQDESEPKLASMPNVTDLKVLEDGNGVEVTLTAAVYPEVTLGQYKGLSAVKPDVRAPESEIDIELHNLRERNASIGTVDRPAGNGDIAVIDFEGFVDGVAFEGGKGENYELTLGSNTFIPGFEDKVMGMVVGEERDLDLVFPENYTEELAGKAVIFKVKLNEVKEKILPELDDEFAKDISEFDTLEEYREDMRKKLRESRQEEADIAFENALMEKLVDIMEADVPEAMIEEGMERARDNFARQMSAYGMSLDMYLNMTGLTPETFLENMRQTAERQVKISLALEKIAELEKIEVSEEDIENEYAEASKRFGIGIDEVKESISRDMVIAEVKNRLAAKVVTDNAVAEDPAEAEESKPAESETEEKPKTAAKKPAAKKPEAKAADAPADDKATEKPKAPAKKPAAKKPAAKAADAPADDKATEKPKAPAKKPAAKKPAAKAADVPADDKATEKPKAPAKKPAAKKPKAEDSEA